jgi:hypothetical protein
MHWMGQGKPPAVRDEQVQTKVFDWEVPVRVDGRRAQITGTLTWIPTPGGGGPPIAALVAVVLAGVLLLVVVRRRRAGSTEPAEAW